MVFILKKVFMDTKMVQLEQREGFGDERYEKVEFQSRVYENFKKLIDVSNTSKEDDTCLVLNAKDSIENLHKTILNRVLAVKNSQKLKSNDFKTLWS